MEAYLHRSRRYRLSGGLLLWLLALPALTGQLPPHSLLWPPEPPHTADPFTKSTRYCHPDFRDRLIALATAAGTDIDNPEGLARFGGWLDLIQLIDQAHCTEPDAATAIRTWLEDHRDHPAAWLFPELSATKQPLLEVGVLLPLQGEMEGPAHWIVEGMSHAAEHSGVNITVIDSIELMAEGGAMTAHQTWHGFDCMIGPLVRTRVEQLAQDPPAQPVLALNYLPADSLGLAPPRLFQIALRPEEEAYALADLIAEAGHTQGILLYAETYPWSRRMATALQDRWIQYGGHLEAYRIPAAQTDFSNLLKEVLQLSASKQRYREITTLLGQPAGFQPRRRQDIEFIVMLVDQRVGRMLKPQLAFWYAGDLPLYSTSKLLSTASFTVNRDLDGVQLTLPPWMVFEHTGITADPENTLERALYFLGENAIRIIQASRCLSDHAPLLNPLFEPAWVFDETTRRFHYRSRHARIREDRIHY